MHRTLSYVLILAASTWTGNAGRAMLLFSEKSHRLRGESTTTASDIATISEVMELPEASVSWSYMQLASPPAWLLPEPLLPNVAYYDVETGVEVMPDEGRVITSWSGVLQEPDSFDDVLWMEGDCGLIRPSTGPAAITFDGQACSAHQEFALPGIWDAAPDGAFTAVWIGRVADGSKLQHSQRVSRTPFTFANALYDTGGDSYGVVPLPPLGEWTLEVVTRSRDTVAGGNDINLLTTYYRYGRFDSDELSWWQGVTEPSEVFPLQEMVLGYDIRTGLSYYYGELAVVALYNKALSKAEVRELAAFFSPRFGWPAPRDPSQSTSNGSW